MESNASCARTRTRVLAVAGWAAVALFAVLAARFWDPCFGFTRFLQFDSSDEAVAIPEMSLSPVFVYEGNNGYDGASYAQIAFHPLLDSADLQRAIGNVPYRAERILTGAVSWILAGGRADRIAHTYAALNLAIWLLLAFLLWRLLPVADWRGWCAWFGLLFSAGALHSVRLALTDLAGATLFAWAMLLSEKNRKGPLGILALGGLARETIVCWVVSVWRGPWLSGRAWAANLARLAAVAAPLVAWVVYVRWKAGPAPQGWGNFDWPVAGYLEKWSASVEAFKRQPEFFLLDAATLLALLGLSVQAAYFVLRPRLNNAWWRAGAIGVALMLCLGRAVWEGNPGAALRVLLPMGVAFAVLTVRDRAGWGWIVLGNLSVLSGVIAFATPPVNPRLVGYGRTQGVPYALRLEDGWFGCERAGSKVWAWTPGRGEISIETWPRGAPARGLRVGLRALSPRVVEIRSGSSLLWRGEVGINRIIVEIGLPVGASEVGFSTDARPVKESANATARALGIEVYAPALVGG